jgi:hypothetical protein
VRRATVSLLAGLDLHSGRVIENVSDTHNSADFVASLRRLDSAFTRSTTKCDSYWTSLYAHLKETRDCLQTMPATFRLRVPPKHGLWLNLIENQFSKMTRHDAASLERGMK